MKLIINTDGGARGNPGPAGIGVFIRDEKGKEVESFGKCIGDQTNNIAEYAAVLAGIEKAKELGADELEFKIDSELVVKQLNREYKVKNAELAKIFLKIYNLQSQFKSVEYKHVYREQNKDADALVNKALDEAGK